MLFLETQTTPYESGTNSEKELVRMHEHCSVSWMLERHCPSLRNFCIPDVGWIGWKDR